MFVAPGCPHCAGLLADLRRRKVRFDVVDLAEEPQRIDEVRRVSWDERVPVVLDHERCSVGFNGRSSSIQALGLRPRG